jgi:hypothetical protein
MENSSKYNIDRLLAKYNYGDKLKYIFFWGHHPRKDGTVGESCLSQWYDCDFVVDGYIYHTAEQYMMCQKAKLFGDEDTFQRILQANHPNEFKSLGRLVKGFDQTIWDREKFNIVVEGNLAKFEQNESLKKFLLSTGDRILVEASPYDRVWGIGIGANDPDVENPYAWKGNNLLGFALMEVRSRLG